MAEKKIIAEVLDLKGGVEIIEWEPVYALKMLSGMCTLAPRLSRTCKVTPLEGAGILIKKVRGGYYVQQLSSKDIVKMGWADDVSEDAETKRFMTLERAVQPDDLPPTVAKAFEQLRELGRVTH